MRGDTFRVKPLFCRFQIIWPSTARGGPSIGERGGTRGGTRAFGSLEAQRSEITTPGVEGDSVFPLENND